MSVHQPHLLPKVRSDQIMASASGRPCTLRIASFLAGRRCRGPETTVLAHLPVWGKGMSTKVTDLAGAYSCSTCHDLIDGRDASGHAYLMENFEAAVVGRMLHGLTETHALMLADGVIQIPGAELV